MATKITTFNPQLAQQPTGYDAGKLNVQDMIEIKTAVNAHADDLDAQSGRVDTLSAQVDSQAAQLTLQAAQISQKQSQVKQQLESFTGPDIAGTAVSGVITNTFTLTGQPLDNFVVEMMNDTGYLKSVIANGQSYTLSYPAATTAILFKYFTLANAVGTVSLVSISLSGNGAISEGATGTYVVTALYSDGSTANVTSTATLSATEGSFSAGGVLTIASNSTAGDGRTITISATFGGKTANKTVSIVDTTSLSTPAAPTAGVVDDLNDTFDWTYSPGYTSANLYEYTLDGGANFATVSAKPLAIGNVAYASGRVGVRVKAGSGNNASGSLFNTTAFTVSSGTVTPAAPTSGVVDDVNNTFDFTYSSGYTSFGLYEYTLDGGASYTTVTAKPIAVGNIAKAIGQVGVRVKAASGNTVSGTLFNTSAFTVTLTTPATPTAGIVDDSANTFDWTTIAGYSAVSLYEYTLDGGATWATVTVKPVLVGNVAKAAGQVGVRVKAGSGNYASGILYNTTAYTASASTPAAPTAGVVDDSANTFDFTYNPSYTTIGAYEFTLDGGTTYTTATVKPIVVGNVAKAIGQVGVRVKASGSNNASTTLFNATAYTAVAGVDQVIFREVFLPKTTGGKASDIGWSFYYDNSTTTPGTLDSSDNPLAIKDDTAGTHGDPSNSLPIGTVNTADDATLQAYFDLVSGNKKQALAFTTRPTLSSGDTLRIIKFSVITWETTWNFAPAILVGTQWYAWTTPQIPPLVSGGGNKNNWNILTFTIDYYAAGGWAPLTLITSPYNNRQFFLNAPITGSLSAGAISGFGVYLYGNRTYTPMSIDNYEITANV